MNIDYNLFSAINGLAGRSSWFDKLGVFFGGDYFLYLFALAFAVMWLKKHWQKRVYLALFSAAIARLVTEFLKHIIGRARPYEVLQVHQLIIDNEHSNSFPSGHATIYFALAFSLWGTKYFWPALAVAVVGSLGRILVGVHYPSDVFVGAIVGAVTALVLKKFFQKHFR